MMLRSLVIAAVISATALSMTPAQAQEKIQPLDCPEGAVQQAECGQLAVPMYYDNADDKTIDVGFIRIPAENQETKHGTLFFNPGGPGGSVYDALSTDFYNKFPAEMRSEWDIVGVQPRGLETSTPLICDDISEIGIVGMLTNYGGEVKQACENHTPGYTASLTTENTARDWEEVRKAMGLKQISIYGISYGTQLASVYATLFPQQTDKLILDSGFNQSMGLDEQVPGTIALNHEFFNWVAHNNSRFKLGTTAAEVYDKWEAKVEEESGTVPTVASPKGKWADFKAETKNASKQLTTGANQQNSPTFQWSQILTTNNQNWHEAAKLINGEWNIADVETAHPQVAQYINASSNKTSEMNLSTLLICNEKTSKDKPWLLPTTAWASLTGDLFSQHYAVGAGLDCKGIAPSTTFPTITGNKLEHQPLQIQGLRDPKTPYESGKDMQQKMGSHLITVDNTNHGHLTNNPTVQKAVVQYLRTGKTDITTAPQPELPLD